MKTTHQHLLLLVGFDTLIYRKYYDTPPILVGHQIRISALFLLRQSLEVFFEFCASPANFAGTGVVLHFNAKR
jgi:hypothetical protein